MKIERKEQKEFVPVVITLESEAELQTLVTCVNTSKYNFDHLTGRRNKSDYGIVSKLYSELDKEL